MSEFTELVLSGMGIPTYSARGLSQSLAPIRQSIQVRRTINGVLLDLSDDAFQKYESVITGNDQEPPSVDMVWPGRLLVVDCLVELASEGELDTGDTETTGEAEYGRTPVPGSAKYSDGFTIYRPRLSMRVTGFNVNRDEWGAAISWTLALEEV